VKDIILPAENRQNVQEDLTPEQLVGLNMHYVKTIQELLDISLPTNRDEVKKDAEIREEVLSTVPVG
jgi:ATP-dependent Lon protease